MGSTRAVTSRESEKHSKHAFIRALSSRYQIYVEELTRVSSFLRVSLLIDGTAGVRRPDWFRHGSGRAHISNSKRRLDDAVSLLLRPKQRSGKVAGHRHRTISDKQCEDRRRFSAVPINKR